MRGRRSSTRGGRQALAELVTAARNRAVRKEAKGSSSSCSCRGYSYSLQCPTVPPKHPATRRRPELPLSAGATARPRRGSRVSQRQVVDRRFRDPTQHRPGVLTLWHAMAIVNKDMGSAQRMLANVRMCGGRLMTSHVVTLSTLHCGVPRLEPCDQTTQRCFCLSCMPYSTKCKVKGEPNSTDYIELHSSQGHGPRIRTEPEPVPKIKRLLLHTRASPSELGPWSLTCGVRGLRSGASGSFPLVPVCVIQVEDHRGLSSGSWQSEDPDGKLTAFLKPPPPEDSQALSSARVRLAALVPPFVLGSHLQQFTAALARPSRKAVPKKAWKRQCCPPVTPNRIKGGLKNGFCFCLPTCFGVLVHRGEAWDSGRRCRGQRLSLTRIRHPASLPSNTSCFHAHPSPAPLGARQVAA